VKQALTAAAAAAAEQLDENCVVAVERHYFVNDSIVWHVPSVQGMYRTTTASV